MITENEADNDFLYYECNLYGIYQRLFNLQEKQRYTTYTGELKMLSNLLYISLFFLAITIVSCVILNSITGNEKKKNMARLLSIIIIFSIVCFFVCNISYTTIKNIYPEYEREKIQKELNYLQKDLENFYKNHPEFLEEEK